MYLPSGEYCGELSAAGLVVMGTALGSPVERDGIEIGIGAGGGHFVGIAGEAELFAVGGDSVIFRAAEGERRHVAIAGREIPRVSAVDWHDEHVAAARTLPGGPVTVEEVGDETRFDGIVFGVIDLLLIARIVGAAIGKDVAEEDEQFAIRGDELAGGFSGEMGELGAGGTGEIGGPDLGGAAFVGGIEDEFGIGRPARAVVGIGGIGEFLRIAALDGHGVDVGFLLVGGRIDRYGGEGDQAAIGRDLGIGNARELEESLDVERSFLREGSSGTKEKDAQDSHQD